jgi:hypothetical protein
MISQKCPLRMAKMVIVLSKIRTQHPGEDARHKISSLSMRKKLD